MDYELIVRPEAKADLLDTFHWYQEQRQGLGHDFKLSIEEVISIIKSNPHIHKTIFQNVRMSVTKRFPFGVFYTVEKGKNHCSCSNACPTRSSEMGKQNITRKSSRPSKALLCSAFSAG